MRKPFTGVRSASQQAGGIPALKDWIVNLDPGFRADSLSDGFRTRDTSFEGFERACGNTASSRGTWPA